MDLLTITIILTKTSLISLRGFSPRLVDITLTGFGVNSKYLFQEIYKAVQLRASIPPDLIYWIVIAPSLLSRLCRFFLCRCFHSYFHYLKTCIDMTRYVFPSLIHFEFIVGTISVYFLCIEALITANYVNKHYRVPKKIPG